jgi:hypothetical protein
MAENGNEHKVIIGDDIILDLSGLFSKNEATESPVKQFLSQQGINSPASKNRPLERQREGLETKSCQKLFFQAEREREERKRISEIFRDYEENRKITELILAQLEKGTAAGEDIHILFLEAAEAISRMRGEPSFYEQMEKNIMAIYGVAFGQQKPLERKINDMKGRILKLKAALNVNIGQDEKARIKRAIAEHEKEIKSLEEIFTKSAAREKYQTARAAE